MSHYPAPTPEEFALLQQFRYLREPGQQDTLQEFAAGTIGIETTVYRLLVAARELYPQRKKERDESAIERADLAWEQRDINENMHLTSPRFIIVGPDGRPLPVQPAPGPVKNTDSEDDTDFEAEPDSTDFDD